MNDWFVAIAQDLRHAAAELLRAGIGPRSTGERDLSWSADPLWLAQTLAALVPKLLVELDPVQGADLVLEPCATAMRRPRPSMRPADHVDCAGRLLPTCWFELRPGTTVDVDALAWLLFVLESAGNALPGHQQRLDRHVAAAVAARASDSVYGRADVAALRRFAGAYHEAGSRLRREMRVVQSAAPAPLRPLDRAPRPFPRSPSWSLLRRLHDVMRRPKDYLTVWLRSMLEGADVASLPFLYQRWVGWKVVEALVDFGFRSDEDPVGSLFLGGVIQLRRRDRTLRLWCEPRLGSGEHPSGLRTRMSEAQPDFVLLFGGRDGAEAFVLDATLSTARADQKGKYRDVLELEAPRFVAGVPVTRRPLRSWAAAPTAGTICDLHVPDGSLGTIPMCPGRFAAGPVRAWLRDAIAHTEAWGSARGDA